jgi:hypothetical protein
MITGFFRTLFSSMGLLIALYLIVGIFTNTATPHLPHSEATITLELHSWVQYAISVLFWPLSFWQPTLTLGKWTA